MSREQTEISEKYHASPLIFIPHPPGWFVGTAYGQRRDFLSFVHTDALSDFLQRQFDLHSHMEAQYRASQERAKFESVGDIPIGDLQGLTIEDFEL